MHFLYLSPFKPSSVLCNLSETLLFTQLNEVACHLVNSQVISYLANVHMLLMHVVGFILRRSFIDCCYEPTDATSGGVGRGKKHVPNRPVDTLRS